MILRIERRPKESGSGPQHITVVVGRCDRCGKIFEDRKKSGSRPYKYCSTLCSALANHQADRMTERSMAIAEEYFAGGGGMRKLAEKHGISQARVHQIVHRYQEIQRRK